MQAIRGRVSTQVIFLIGTEIRVLHLSEDGTLTGLSMPPGDTPEENVSQ